MMANKEIGEVSIMIGGVEYTLRPSFRCFAEIEDRAGKGVMDIARDMSSGKVHIKDIVAIIYGGVYGALGEGEKMPFTFSELGDRIVADGYPSFATPSIIFFSEGLRGLSEKKKQTT